MKLLMSACQADGEEEDTNFSLGVLFQGDCRAGKLCLCLYVADLESNLASRISRINPNWHDTLISSRASFEFYEQDVTLYLFLGLS